MEKGGRKKYITERNGRSSYERQGIVAFCTWQWNERMNEYLSCVSSNYRMSDRIEKNMIGSDHSPVSDILTAFA